MPFAKINKILLFGHCNKLFEVGVETIADSQFYREKHECVFHALLIIFNQLLLHPNVDLCQAQKTVRKYPFKTWKTMVTKNECVQNQFSEKLKVSIKLSSVKGCADSTFASSRGTPVFSLQIHNTDSHWNSL